MIMVQLSELVCCISVGVGKIGVTLTHIRCYTDIRTVHILEYMAQRPAVTKCTYKFLSITEVVNSMTRT